MSDSPGNQDALATLDVFRLDAVQKTKKTDKNVKDRFGSPEKKCIQNLTMTG